MRLHGGLFTLTSLTYLELAGGQLTGTIPEAIGNLTALETLYLGGSPIGNMMFWVPQTGDIGLGVSILSYAGHVQVGVLTDEGLVPDPETIVAAFHDEYEDLLAHAHAAKARATSRDRASSGSPELRG